MNWTRNAPQYWRPDIGPWMPVHKRVAPPRRWLRYVALIIFLGSGTWSVAPHLTAWGEATPVIARLGPHHSSADTRGCLSGVEGAEP